MKNLKNFLIFSLIVLIISCISNYSFAAGITILDSAGNTTTNEASTAAATNEQTANAVQPANTNNQANAVTPVNNVTSGSGTTNYVTPTNTNAQLPQTGENDVYIIGALLVVFGVFAVYAYKKIRQYNV